MITNDFNHRDKRKHIVVIDSGPRLACLTLGHFDADLQMALSLFFIELIHLLGTTKVVF